MMKRLTALLLTALMALCLLPAQAEGPQTIETGVMGIDKYGNVTLNISGTGLLNAGYAFGDVVTVTLGGQGYDMPICDSFGEVDSGERVCRAYIDAGKGADWVIIALNQGDFATSTGLAKKVEVQQDPGFRWDYAGGEAPAATIAMKEPGGYLEQYQLRSMTYTNNRQDYPNLTDAEYANFRAVTTPGMGVGALYRSSSPVNPAINRNAQADAALNGAGIVTIINMADTEDGMKAYEGYANTYYAQRKSIALNMNLDFMSEEFHRKLARGLRFLAENDGPYLIHCNEGKERTGFACALLECLMGAPFEDVAADYMTSYRNFYGLVPGDGKYETVMNSTIIRNLNRAFSLDDVTAGDADLSACAAEYLRACGMTDAEIEAVKMKLAEDWTK